VEKDLSTAARRSYKRSTETGKHILEGEGSSGKKTRRNIRQSFVKEQSNGLNGPSRRTDKLRHSAGKEKNLAAWKSTERSPLKGEKEEESQDGGLVQSSRARRDWEKRVFDSAQNCRRDWKGGEKTRLGKPLDPEGGVEKGWRKHAGGQRGVNFPS